MGEGGAKGCVSGRCSRLARWAAKRSAALSWKGFCDSWSSAVRATSSRAFSAMSAGVSPGCCRAVNASAALVPAALSCSAKRVATALKVSSVFCSVSVVPC
ncbi:hypothetical protein DUGA6_40150 [Duganella sp. HH105]|nr:hypothetical protein DUGA6_40150 [Duganella sp. HH105]